MSKWIGQLAALFVSGLLLGGCGLPQYLQDTMDQAELRRLFGLPRGARVLSYAGYPSMVGFGQREGLSLDAAFELTDDEGQTFLAQAAEGGWQPLPMSDALFAHIPFQGLSVPLDQSNGLYLCRTAGNEVLHARETKGCVEVARINDLILGIFDATTNSVWVTVRSGY